MFTAGFVAFYFKNTQIMPGFYYDHKVCFNGGRICVDVMRTCKSLTIKTTNCTKYHLLLYYLVKTQMIQKPGSVFGLVIIPVLKTYRVCLILARLLFTTS